jgi:hypothetical protein
MVSDKQLQLSEGLGDRCNIGWRAVTRSSRPEGSNVDAMLGFCAPSTTPHSYTGLVLLLDWSYVTGLTMTTLNTAQGHTAFL